MSFNQLPQIVHVFEDAEFESQLSKLIDRELYDYLSIDDFEDAFEMLNLNVKAIFVSFNNVNQPLSIFFRQIKTSKFNNIPIVALISTKEHIHTKNILKIGFSDYISTDYSPEIIVEQIDEFVTKGSLNTLTLDSLTVAIIDDDVLHTQLLSSLLKMKKAKEVAKYKSGEEFLKNPKKCDIYLVDIVMDKISGIKLTQRIRKLYPKSLIIVVSSISEDKVITTSLVKGADDFIKKPINSEIFFAKIISRMNNNTLRFS